MLIAVLLSLAVLIGWQQLFPAPQPGQQRVSETTTADQPAGVGSEGAATRGGDPASPFDSPSAGAEAEVEPEEAYEPVSASREEEVVVETDLYRAVLTNRGGQLVSFVLSGHESHNGDAVDLVRSRADGAYPYAFVDPSGQPLPLNGQLFAVERGENSGGATSVTFLYSGPEGVASKRFDFSEQGLFDVTVEVERPARWALFIGPGIRNPSLEELENRFERRAAVYRMDGEVENLDTTGTEERISLPAGALEWVGLEDTYFLSAVIPREPVGGVVVAPYLLSEGSAGGDWSFRDLPPEDELTEEEEEAGRDLGLIIRPDDGRLALTSYWGAKKYQRLSAMDYGLEETITIWSLLRPIAVPLLWALVWVYENVVHNYGWAIVLVTIVIKLILLPLTHKSFVSMRKMQELNPQMQAIRAKWKSKLRDKQGKMNMEAQRKMNEEMQELYREAGVNPVGGCLPMVLQMPVLFAFYQLLTTAVELRGAPWMLWITDLSQPSFVVGGFPFEPLALVMGVTQVIQQRLTPMAGDPMQRKLMQAMPILFTLFFLGFPSGLVLYWLTNNLLTILQHSILQRSMSKKDDQSASGDSKHGTQKGSKSSRRVAKK